MLGRNRQNKPNGFCSCCVLRSGAEIVLLTRTDETNDASGIVSISLNHGNFSAGLYIKQGSSRGSLQRFSSSSLQLNRSIILLFPELMEKEPRHHLVHKIACTIRLQIHFLRVSCTEKRNVEKSSITVSVNDVFFYIITYQIHLDETKLMTLFHVC